MDTINLINIPMNSYNNIAYYETEIDFGRFVTLNGTFSSSEIDSLPDGQKNKPGYASEGDNKLSLATSGDTGACFPIKRYIAIPEDDESDHDSVKAGQMAIYFTEGEFETDQFASGTNLIFGDYLRLTVSGTLVPELDVDVKTSNSVARVVKYLSGAGSESTDRLWFRLIK